MNKVFEIYLQYVSNKRIQIYFFIFLNIFGLVFIFLPHQIFVNMVDLKLGYNSQDVFQAFDNMGEKGRSLHIYSSLVLDTIIPILYVSLVLGAYVKLFSKEISYIYIIPILAGLFDIGENIQSVIMNHNYTNLSENQVFIASSFTLIKFFFLSLMISILIFGIFKKKIKR